MPRPREVPKRNRNGKERPPGSQGLHKRSSAKVAFAVWFLVLFFETESPHVIQASLRFTILLPQPPKGCWDDRHAGPPDPSILDLLNQSCLLHTRLEVWRGSWIDNPPYTPANSASESSANQRLKIFACGGVIRLHFSPCLYSLDNTAEGLEEGL